MKQYDLHNHTIASSDGKITGEELIDIAAARRVKGLGICDHDVFPDESLYDYAKFKGIKLALGTEFTCEKAHIIGYNFDIKGEDKEYVENRFKQLKENQISVSRQFITELNGAGIDITLEKVQEFYGRKDPAKLFILKYLAEGLGMFPSWSEARKFVQIKGIYPKLGDGLRNPDPTDIVDIIHRGGGYAIWAHPFITPEGLREQYFETLPEHRVDAIEADYAYEQNGYKGKETNRELDTIVRGILKDKKVSVSGGSDSHFPLKTYSDLSPIMPGDFGITEKEYRKLENIFY